MREVHKRVFTWEQKGQDDRYTHVVMCESEFPVKAYAVITTYAYGVEPFCEIFTNYTDALANYHSQCATREDAQYAGMTLAKAA